MRILIVEDHEDSLDAMQHLLAKHHYEITTAATLKDARELCESSRFDLLLCDIGLPDGDAWELARVAQAHGYPAIAVSGYGMPTDLDRSASSGFVEHLIKPIRFDALLSAISRAVPAAARV